VTFVVTPSRPIALRPVEMPHLSRSREWVTWNARVKDWKRQDQIKRGLA